MILVGFLGGPYHGQTRPMESWPTVLPVVGAWFRGYPFWGKYLASLTDNIMVWAGAPFPSQYARFSRTLVAPLPDLQTVVRSIQEEHENFVATDFREDSFGPGPATRFTIEGRLYQVPRDLI